jgi:hypothetical protein
MKSRIEDELRAHFERVGSTFEMDRSLPSHVLRRARRRTRRVTAAVTAAAVVIGGVSAFALRLDHRGTSSTVAATKPVVVRLVDYAPESGTESPDDPAFDSVFQQHIQCMRDQGFDVPNPVQSDHGWSIVFPPGSDPLSDPRWREAALVTCNLLKFENRPLPGDLVMGIGAEKMAEFLSCMRTQGYDLPQPEVGSDGQYRWPLQALQGLGIDTRTDEWNRAVFMTCSPGNQ